MHLLFPLCRWCLPSIAAVTWLAGQAVTNAVYTGFTPTLQLVAASAHNGLQLQYAQAGLALTMYVGAKGKMC